MDRTIKPLKEDTGEPEASAEAPTGSLTDFLARGLRESQRPPPPGRESQRPSGVVRTSQPPASTPREDEGSVAAPVVAGAVDPAAGADEGPRSGAAYDEDAGLTEAGAVAGAAVAVDEPVDDALRDSPVADASLPPESNFTEADSEIGESDPDYVVPVPLLARRRLIAGVAAAALLIIALVFWLSRGTKVPPHLDVPPATPATMAHEPLPPGPPPVAEPAEPISETIEETVSGASKGAGAPAPAEPSGSPPFGPNVARYPDLPTPVLMQLEKDQEEKASAPKTK